MYYMNPCLRLFILFLGIYAAFYRKAWDTTGMRTTRDGVGVRDYSGRTKRKFSD
jgi:hypothetical protein